MKLHAHILRGCAPDPLAHYLKALGVLRLVGQQVDPGARGAWRDGAFVLVTSLDRDALIAFFLEGYAPTPLLAPWNGGSGFYPKDNRDGIDPIARSGVPRFAEYARAIDVARSLIDGRSEAPKKEEKELLLGAYVRAQGERATAWAAAAVALDHSGRPRYPALLGTGGNDGRLDFTNNFMQRLVELIDPETGTPRPHARAILEASLFAAPGRVQERAPIGQFLPGAAGGANGGPGFSSESAVNVWDFILALEGAVTLRVSSLRKLEGELSSLAAPFALRNTTAGYASATDADGSARGEQWFPLWEAPATAAEIDHLFAEAKLAGGGGREVRDALDASRAVARLGASRGISGFQRFGFIERNGQANLGVPLGIVSTRHAPEVRLLDEIDGWMDGFRRAARGDHAPAILGVHLRALESSAIACSQAPHEVRPWQDLVRALGAAEDSLIHRPKFTAEARLRPLPKLAASWLDRIQDGSPEVRLAIALASAGPPAGAPRAIAELGSIRVHCAPLDQFERSFATGADALLHDPRVVWTGRALVDDLVAVVLRRCVDGARAGAAEFPLHGRRSATLGDVARFLTGSLDDGRIAQLTRGLMTVSASGHDPAGDGRRAPGSLAPFALIRTALSPFRDEGPCDAAILRQLLTAGWEPAARLARGRLGARGIRPKIHHLRGSPITARRLVAALAFPLSRTSHQRLADLVGRAFTDTDPREPDARAPAAPGASR